MEIIEKIMIDDQDLAGAYDWNEAVKQIELLDSQNYQGFSDWRLPTKEELNVMYINRDTIGGFSTSFYWNSTEFNANLAWFQYFSNGSQDYGYKYFNLLVRCVRSI